MGLDPRWASPTLQPGVGLEMGGCDGCTLLLATWLQAHCWAILPHRNSTEVLQQRAASPQLLDEQSQQRRSRLNLTFPGTHTKADCLSFALFSDDMT